MSFLNLNNLQTIHSVVRGKFVICHHKFKTEMINQNIKLVVAALLSCLKTAYFDFPFFDVWRHVQCNDNTGHSIRKLLSYTSMN